MKERFSDLFVLALLLYVLYLVLRLMEPFASALICALTLAIVFYPMHQWISRLMHKRSPSFQALMSDFIVFLFFVIPITLLMWAIIAEVNLILPAMKPQADRLYTWMHNPHMFSQWLQTHSPFLYTQLGARTEQVQNLVGTMINRAAQLLGSLGATLASKTIALPIQLVIFLIALFFAFRDGEFWVAKCNQLLPLDNAGKKRIHDTLHRTLIGVVRGSFLTALIQGFTAAVGFFVVSRKAAVLLGALTALATFIPGIGRALVWVPVSLFFLLTGVYWKGIFIAVWGLGVVSVLDNLIRPYIVGTKAELPFLWLFFSLLGGIEVFGLLGILIGPLIMGVVPVLFDLYEIRFLHHHPSKNQS